MDHVISVLVEPVLFAIGLITLSVWFARSRRRAEASNAPGTMRHSSAVFILGLVTTIFFLGLAILAYVTAESAEERSTALYFLPLAALGVLLVAEYMNARHGVTDEGFHYGTLRGARGFVAWKDLRRVSYSPLMQWFRLETRDGRVVRVSAMLTGLRELATQLVASVPSHVVEKRAGELLTGVREGRPIPGVWM